MLAPSPLGAAGTHDHAGEEDPPEHAVEQPSTGRLAEEDDVQCPQSEHRDGRHDEDLNSDVQGLPPQKEPGWWTAIAHDGKA